ncbi:efflux transporter periplasmic adaptor subunit [Pseudomonas daroniae]|uniref:Efflux transporter periplasmic adaptor subunit n=1 Tax=Phytopseudomonas daroniae TaxID=2487519 RepID=A0A4V6MX29_9GAMM|nr:MULTISPECIES: efflux RND transporter periplasmic adaptor subunit [Pseudomonas]TBU77966.1 efflux transporter periplasmic adaptor subunit [Pseudomonas daroniae]TBU82314.1 efflux transporter periplasmic adaptor subunit [Pseudomonas sp. FRB 228]TBU91059.1 efflux transporter periplasmic adaptor subunit [Pseudomonas daroniae]
MLFPIPRPLFKHLCFLPVILLLAACSPEPVSVASTPEVGVWTVRAQRLAMHQTLPGRTVAHMVSDVRPQVGGIIQQRLFTEGQDVKAGQILYQIDPATYQAAYDNAKGALAQAQAAVLSARPKAQRYANLAKLDAVSQQDLEEAVATLRQNEAAVMVAQAALQTARINLDYTRVSAPIDGRIGASVYTPGALVTAGQTTALATIQQLDPIYVDVTQSSAELLALRKQLDSGALTSLDGKVPVQIQLEDGSLYEHSGTLEFVGTSVDTGTGNVVSRALIPNPDRLLLPGAYVRAILPVAINDKAILVPQSAVGRNTRGEATVKLVGDDGRLIERMVQTGDAQKDQWIISAGLQPGEQLVVEGGSKVQAGQAVKTHEVAAPAPDLTGVPLPTTDQPS